MMVISEPSESQDSLKERFLASLKRTCPDLIMINSLKEVTFFKGNEVLYLSTKVNYTDVNSTNNRTETIKRPLKKVYPFFINFVICIGDGLALNFNRIKKIEKGNWRVTFDDDSIMLMRKCEGKILCQIIRWYVESKLNGNIDDCDLDGIITDVCK